MEIRPATPADIQRIIDITQEMVSMYPRLRPNNAKIKTMISKSISSPACYTSVAVDASGVVQGCLMTVVQDHMWAERKVAHMGLWVSHLPRAGYALLRDFVSWLGPRRGIRLAGIQPDFDWDIRIEKLLTRAGFEKLGGSFLYHN